MSVHFAPVDPMLRTAFEDAGVRAELLGLAAAAVGGRTACAVATDRPLSAGDIESLAAAVGALEGTPPAEVAALDATELEPLLRQWVNQAAQGAGRGVGVRVETPAPGAVRVLLRAIDSSARELTLRLGSPYEPALPALRALLGAAVSVEDEESS